MQTDRYDENQHILFNFYRIIKKSNFYVPAILCILFIIIWDFVEPAIQQKMHVTLFNLADIKFDWWSFTHILLYIYFGYQFPDNFAFFIIGTIWEIIESILSLKSGRRIIEKRIGKQRSKIIGYHKLDYWYGRIDDIIMNSCGFVIGMWLASKLK
jgi:glycopeptide antibiotics resistance protein